MNHLVRTAALLMLMTASASLASAQYGHVGSQEWFAQMRVRVGEKMVSPLAEKALVNIRQRLSISSASRKQAQAEGRASPRNRAFALACAIIVRHNLGQLVAEKIPNG